MKKHLIRAHFKPQSINEAARTVDLCFATEAKVLRQNDDGSQFYEVLAMNPRHANLDRLNNGGALLDNHNRSSIDDQIGVIEKAWINATDKTAMVTARFSAHPERQRLWDDVRSGIIQNVSFGYTVDRFISLSEYNAMCRAEKDEEDKDEDEEKRNDDDEETDSDKKKRDEKKDDEEEKRDSKEEDDEKGARSIPTLVGIGWQALEISLVTIPADIEAGTRSQSDTQQLTRTTNIRTNMKENENSIDSHTQKAMQRLLKIKEITRTAKLPEEVETRYLNSTLTLDDIRKDAFKEMATRSNQNETRAHITPGGLDETQTRREGMENAILHRASPHKFKLDDRGKRFAQMSLLGLARRSLEYAGVKSVENFSDDELVTRSLQGTSEFPILLTNVVNKSLRADYEGAPSIWRNFTRIVPAKDFRPIHRMQLGDIPVPTRVNEKGEARRVTLSEGGTSYQIHTYEQIINFSRQVMINDDIGFIATIPGKLGLACAELEANIVLGLITGDTMMSDKLPLFCKEHNNILEGGHIIDLKTTSIVRALMRRHTGLDGRKLNIVPASYLVPTALETIAEQFVSTNLLANQTTAINPFAGQLGVLCDVRLDDTSATDWYMIANPSSIDIIEAAYLNGASGPKVESRYGFEISGMEIKVQHDFGAGVIDHRGIFRVEGVDLSDLVQEPKQKSRSKAEGAQV